MSESPPPKPPIPPIPPILRKTPTLPKRRILPILSKLPKRPKSRSLPNLRAKPQHFSQNFPVFSRKVLGCTELLFCVGRFLLRLMLLSLRLLQGLHRVRYGCHFSASCVSEPVRAKLTYYRMGLSLRFEVCLSIISWDAYGASGGLSGRYT